VPTRYFLTSYDSYFWYIKYMLISYPCSRSYYKAIMLQVVDMASSFYLKDFCSCYSYGRLYRQYTSGWEGYRSAECSKIAVKRTGRVETAKQAPNVLFRNGSTNKFRLQNLGGEVAYSY
jgi:hypothetical protein